MEFVDPTNVCPLCKCITERDGDEVLEKKPTYPFHPGKEIKKIHGKFAYTIQKNHFIVQIILPIQPFTTKGDRSYAHILKK